MVWQATQGLQEAALVKINKAGCIIDNAYHRLGISLAEGPVEPLLDFSERSVQKLRGSHG